MRSEKGAAWYIKLRGKLVSYQKKVFGRRNEPSCTPKELHSRYTSRGTG